eukprot:scaffold24333_cov49-Attheya_sp.AAC.1
MEFYGINNGTVHSDHGEKEGRIHPTLPVWPYQPASQPASQPPTRVSRPLLWENAICQKENFINQGRSSPIVSIQNVIYRIPNCDNEFRAARKESVHQPVTVTFVARTNARTTAFFNFYVQ